MSLRRAAAAAAVVALAVLATPAALTPGVNSADLITILAPLALIAIYAPRRPQTPAGERTPPTADAPHVEAPPAGPLR